jgi:hypothetical protein
MPVVRAWSYTTVFRPHVSLVSAETILDTQAKAVSNSATLETDADGWHAAR